MGGRGRPSSSRLAGYSGVPSPWRARAEEWAARGGGERAAPGGSAVAGESRGRASASGVAPTDAVTPSPLSAPACMRVGLHVALCWRAVLARSLARSVAQVPRPWPIPELVCPAEPRSARHGRRYGMCRPYSPRFARVRVVHGLSVQFSIYHLSVLTPPHSQPRALRHTVTISHTSQEIPQSPSVTKAERLHQAWVLTHPGAIARYTLYSPARSSSYCLRRGLGPG